jgi:hypothetical protein
MNKSVLHYNLASQSLSLRVCQNRRSCVRQSPHRTPLAVAESLERTTATNLDVPQLIDR